jgi:hypothetical protein
MDINKVIISKLIANQQETMKKGENPCQFRLTKCWDLLIITTQNLQDCFLGEQQVIPTVTLEISQAPLNRFSTSLYSCYQ